jgi:hypothetical protein
MNCQSVKYFAILHHRINVRSSLIATGHSCSKTKLNVGFFPFSKRAPERQRKLGQSPPIVTQMIQLTITETIVRMRQFPQEHLQVDHHENLVLLSKPHISCPIDA